MSRMEQKMQLAERVAKIKEKMKEVEKKRLQREYWGPKIRKQQFSRTPIYPIPLKSLPERQ